MASSTPLHGPRAVSNQAQILVIIDKVVARTELSVIHRQTAKLLSYVCSPKLDIGAFADLPISVDVDHTGAGMLNIGTNSHWIHENATLSGGITCGRMYNDMETFISCDVTLPTSVLLRLQANSLGPYPVLLLLQTPMHETAMRTDTTFMIGDGDPHQNFFHQQVSQNMNCAAADRCSIETGKDTSFSIGWWASADALSWLSGGFSVEQTWEVTESWKCDGQRDQTVCVWCSNGYTSYRVRNEWKNVDCGDSYLGDPFIMYSPNTDNPGGGNYCVIGDQYCRSQGAGYWDYNTRAGGP
ncbi:hypothetical protein QBC46DRAFT_440464 [Diplogelasinospora grovesii]|uniref:Uncharacterized protein n=1 Tax=Diplogelasinospora grovesii TaxID=303347 RepID=A0AAN6S3G8_9PEZI|nr:hypothetical protein QBC46DRAFT_440464 [Diplogelasinospora grovesii]